MSWILANIHHPWSAVVTPYGAWFTYVISLYVLYVLYLWLFQFFSLKAEVRWLKFKYTYPVIGSLKKMAKRDGDNSSEKDLNRFTDGEKEIYGAFKTAINKEGTPKKKEFDDALDYINAAGDKGQSPMTIGAYLVVIALSSIEMVAVAQILADFMSGGAMSQSTGTIVGIAFGIVLAGASAIFLHEAVVEWYKRDAIFTSAKKCRDESYPEMAIDGLDKSDNDAGAPKCRRLLNRIKDSDNGYERGVIPKSLMGFLLIVAFLIATIFYMRYEQFQNNYSAVDCSVYQDLDEKSVCETDNSLKLVQKEEAKGVIIAGNAMFAVIYILVLMAIAVFSFRRATVGSHTKEAYNKTKGYASYAPMANEINHAVSVANHLRNQYSSLYSQYSEKRLRLNDNGFDRSFIDYLLEKNSKGQLEDSDVSQWYILQDKLNKDELV